MGLDVCAAQGSLRQMLGVEIDSLRKGQQDLSRNGASGARER